jgi:uncharacterized phage protein (TIGR01671 family)
MREIKFRAWDKEEKKMSETFELGGNNSVAYKDIEGVHMFGKDDLGCVEFELMQYTGLKTADDHGGKEIYEGDIVFNHSVSMKKSGPVEFSDIHHAYIINYPKTHKDNWEFMHGNEHNFEVIGNIYENPELIK